MVSKWWAPFLCTCISFQDDGGGGWELMYYSPCTEYKLSWVWSAIVFAGAGLATVVISFLFTTYYNVIIAWAFYYLFHCFQSVLPWTACDHDWNSPNCWDGTATQNYTNSTTNTSYLGPAMKPYNGTISPTEDFYQ